MLYELMDVETANVVGVYENEAEALAEVRALLRANGPDYAEALALGYEDKRGRGKMIVEGSELAQRALAAGPDGRERISA